ncbi:MAG: hypothetical protein WCG40_04480 [Actinomycetes bacterium]
MSLTEISTRLAFVVGLAILALLAIGRRKPARETNTPSRQVTSTDPARPSTGGELLDETHPLNAPRPEIKETIARKVLNATGLAGIALVSGIIAALVISLSLAYIVTNFVSRL